MIFQSIRNDTNLDKTMSFFLNGNNMISTQIGDALKQPLRPSQVVTVAVVNNNSSAMSLTAVEGRENNSQDPLNYNNLFVPDGMLILSQGGYTLAPGQELDFQFDLSPGADNWSFEITYYVEGSGVSLDDIVATDVSQ